jgi:teichuronic acid biosynthesis glycosyltransferase TuaC
MSGFHHRPKIAVVTPLYPTASEPYRAAAIWNTLRELSAHADLCAYCVQARYPGILRPRSFRHHPEPADGRAYGIDARTIPYFAVPGLTRTLNGATIYRALRRHVLAGSPDLILSYWIYPDGYAAVQLGRSMDIPVLVGSRGSDLRRMGRNPTLRRKIRYTLQHASAVLCVSGDLTRIARDLGAPPAATHTITNGVDSSVFEYRPRAEARLRLGLSPDTRLVLFVGWLSALKGVPQLVEAIALLNSSGSPEWKAILIGEGHLETALRQQAERLGIAGKILFLGGSKPAVIAEWQNACDLFCLPSESEGCPNVVLEALSCGRAVVATSVGGIPELVGPDCGVLIPDNRPRTIADALQRASAIDWNREQIAHSNQRSWSRVAAQTFQVCESAMAGKQLMACS